MEKKRKNVAIMENAPIVREGVQILLQKSHLFIKTILIKEVENLHIHADRLKIDVIMINPNLLVNRLKYFTQIKNNFPNIKWIALSYTILEKEIQSFFDETIPINDSFETITRKIEYFLAHTDKEHVQILTDREQNVLKEIIKGHSNKEIADQLNISIHTVMSHRKNIYQKTDIKSQAGLTVYALTHNIVTLENM
ncbi:MAG TPA: response regulator transcription factor [Bacteroidales bacterium]|jgi:DNA-binding NarL/FixJ family response regulator|nr:response regulator transcription factor [Bacteroidales bacterium]HPE41009.1 response regulator transcription factor [Bacteroidales bacterium]